MEYFFLLLLDLVRRRRPCAGRPTVRRQRADQMAQRHIGRRCEDRGHLAARQQGADGLRTPRAASAGERSSVGLRLSEADRA